MLAGMALLFLNLCASPVRAGITNQSRPEIFCEFSSSRAPIDADRVQIIVDDQDVTANAHIQAWRVSYIPEQPMAPGRHFVRVKVTDLEGHSGEKSWEFTIDPSAGETRPATIAFVPPTPDNGAVLASGQVTIAVAASRPDSFVPDPDTLALTLFRNGSPVDMNFAPDWTVQNHSLALQLASLAPGRYSLLLSSEQANREITTAFIVDPDPPRIASFAIEPNQIHAGSAFSANLIIEDQDQANLDMCSLVFSKDGREISTKKIRASQGANKLLLKSSDIESRPRGRYLATIRCTDAAGRSTDQAGPAEISVSDAPPLLQAMDAPASRGDDTLAIHTPQHAVSQPYTDITGRAPADSFLLLYVNSSSVLERRADSTGAFRFDRVPLEPGDNTIFVALEDSEGITSRESQPVFVSFLPPGDAVAALPDPGEPVIQEPDPPEQTPIDEPIVSPVDEPVIDPEPEPAVEPQNPPDAEPEPEIDPEPEPAPDPEPVELTIHVPPGAAQGNGHAPIHATAPPGVSVTLFLNGNPVATVAANNGGQAHFQDVLLIEGNNELFVSATAAGIEYRSDTVSVIVETRGNHNR